MPPTNGAEKVFKASEHDPAEQKNDKQIAEVGDVVLYFVNASLDWRPKDLAHLVSDNLREGEMHEAIEDIGEDECRRDEVANDAVTDFKDSAGVKSGIGLDCLAAGLQFLECGVNAIFEEGIGEAHEADREQQERSGDEYEVNSDQHVADPREVRTCAEVGNGAAKDEQQPFRGDSQKEKQHKNNCVAYCKGIGKTRRDSAAAENEPAYSPAGDGHARDEDDEGQEGS